MRTSIKLIAGNWDLGYALDKHVVSSTFIGHDQFGHARFDTKRTEVGEALYQLKYQGDWSQTQELANALSVSLFGKYSNVGVLVPMPASNVRPRQPVMEITRALGNFVQVPLAENLLIKARISPQLKDISNKAEKLAVLEGGFAVNVLLVDDLFDTGATMGTACAKLREYRKVARIYVAALTWK